MRVSDKALATIKDFEGCRLEAYKCPAGVWTIGYGHTKGVKKGMSISERQAESLLRGDLLPCEKYVDSLGMGFTQGEFDALVDFCFNLGETNLAGSTLLRKIRQKTSEKEIRAEFGKWVFAKGVILKGLVRRREWEADRFFTR